MAAFSTRRERPSPQSVEVVCCVYNHGTPNTLDVLQFPPFEEGAPYSF